MNLATPFPDSYDPVRWWAQFAPRRTALTDRSDGRRYSYGDLDHLAAAAAVWLQRQGTRHGDRVAVLAPNCVETLVLFIAAVRLGAALVPLNWRLAPGELQAVLDDAQPRLALHHPTLRPTRAHGIRWFDIGDAFSSAGTTAGTTAGADASGAGASRTAPPAADAAERAALILYTSGSTGRPKGVMLPQRQIFYNAVATCTAWELGPADVAPLTTPLFHTGGWNVFLTPLWLCGGSVVITERFEPAQFLGMMAEEACTVALTVPTQLIMLLEAVDWGRPLPALRRFFCGGAPCPPALADAVRQAGYALREGYGLTECGPNCFALSDEEAVRRPGAVGRPMPFLDARLCDEQGEDVAAGAVGELLLRGPQLFAGYFGDAARTAEVLSAEGWLRTGDLARRAEDGLYSICGRRREMFISGGENVFPGEVEAVLVSCPGVRDAAVLGVPDARWGEVGHAFIVAADGTVDETAIASYARTNLAAYKVPRCFTLLPDLPRLGSGKVDRRTLLRLTTTEET